MSFQYDQYLTQHRSNVKRGFDWIAENLPELLVDGFDYGWQIEFAHDKSKDEQDEYEAYDAYFCLNFLESIFDIKPEDLQKAIDVKLERERRNL